MKHESTSELFAESIAVDDEITPPVSVVVFAFLKKCF